MEPGPAQADGGGERGGSGEGGGGVGGSRGGEHCRGEAEKRRAIHSWAETEKPVKRSADS